MITPNDLSTIYNFKPVFARGNYGIGQTIYLIENSDMYNTNDWSTFRTVFQHIWPSQFNLGGQSELKSIQRRPAVQTIAPLRLSMAVTLEAILDAEYASAGAPGANIMMATYSDTGGVTTGILIAIQNLVNSSSPPAIISNSYGWCEVKAGATMNAAISTAYQTGVAEGISIYVSAGDQGTAGCTPGGTSERRQHRTNTGIGVALVTPGLRRLTRLPSAAPISKIPIWAIIRPIGTQAMGRIIRRPNPTFRKFHGTLPAPIFGLRHSKVIATSTGPTAFATALSSLRTTHFT